MIEKSLSMLLLLFLFSVRTVSGQQANEKIKSDFLPVSVWYSGGKARAPMLSKITPESHREWETDLKQIKALGFNTVRTWVEWAHCEPRPGEYHFENLKLLCELAQQTGLKVMIQLYADSAPDWVGKLHPDGLFVTQSGAKVKSQSAPGYCTDHAGVREAMLGFYAKTAEIAVQYPNFWGYDLWSEPHIVNWAYINYVPNVQFCFCPHTMQRFRDWLQTKYKILKKLNQAWYRNYESWEAVEPPRFGTILIYTDFIDWKNFIYEKLAGDLRMRYEAIRQVDATHVITSHAAVPSIFYSPYNGYGATDDFLMAQQVNFYGTSLYPKHNHPDRHWETWKFRLAVDFSRSANQKNGGFYVGEMQAGRGTIGLNIGNPITPADHRIWMWSVIAKGAKAINIYAYYPMSSGYESGGYGLINLDGSLTERAQNAGKIARIINEHQNLLLNSKRVLAEVALIYNPLAQMVGGEQRHLNQDGHYLSLVGYFKFFAEENIQVDFIHRQDLEKADDMSYKLIIFPYPLMLTRKAAANLEKFVAAGGKVLSEARLAWNDERGFATQEIPGMGLSRVFGARENDIRMQPKVKMSISNFRHRITRGMQVADSLTGAFFAESFEPKSGSQVLGSLEDGSPGIIASRFGSGETLLIGSFLGMANYEQITVANRRFLQGVLDWAEISRLVKISEDGDAVEVCLRKHATGDLVFVLNHTTREKTVTLEFASKKGWYQITDIFRNQKFTAETKEGSLNLRLNLKAKDVAVLNIIKKQ